MNRLDFPFFLLPNKADYAYLDSAATSLKPSIVIDAITQSYTQLNGSARRGLYNGAEDSAIAIEQARTIIAQFLKTDASDLMFTKNTTDAINLVALTWGEGNIREGDEIVVTAREHHANFIPWQKLALRKKAKFVVIPVDAQGELVKNCTDYITLKTKLVAIGHVSNVTGTVSRYLKNIIDKARQVNARVMVDGAQAINFIENPLQKTDPDFYAFSGHKICGPFEVGILYVKKEVQVELTPFIFGGGAVFEVQEDFSTLLPFPQGFEPGTLPAPEIIGLKAAIEYIHRIGIKKIATHANSLVRFFLENIDKTKITLIGEYEKMYNETHLVSFVVKGFHAHDVAAYLSEKGIAVRAGNHCAQPLHTALGYDATVRISFYIYNTEDDVKKLVSALHELV